MFTPAQVTLRNWLAPGLAIGLGIWLLTAPGGNDHTRSIADDSTSDAEKPFAVVELFTSQGCSSCPSADRNFRRLAESARTTGTRLFALSFHVDYWNRLGWIDPYSRAEFSARQSTYARFFEAEGVYTPQMIVNGTVEFVGSDVDRSDKAVAAALRQPRSGVDLSTEIEVTPAPDLAIKVDYTIHGAAPDDDLLVTLVRASASNSVPRGENAGRTLQHIHVVSALATVSRPRPQGQVTLTLPTEAKPQEFAVIAFVQNSKTRAMRAAVEQPVR